MPTYEYRCPKGHVFDVFQKMSDPPKAKCPVCGKPGARQIVLGAGFLLKGEGFYITDNRPDSYKKDASSDAIPGTTYEGKGGGSKGSDSGSKESGKSDEGGKKESPAKDSGAKEGGSKKKRSGGRKGSE